MNLTCPSCGFSARLASAPPDGSAPLCPRCDNEIPVIEARDAEAPPPVPEPSWERRDALLDLGAMASTVKGALARPQEFFARLTPRGGYRAAILFFVICSLVGGLGKVFSKQLVETVTGGDLASPLEIGIKVALLVLALPLAAPTLAFFVAGLMHLGLLIVRGAKSGFSATFKVVVYVAGATSLLNVVPVAGPVVGFVWGVISQVVGLRTAHHTSYPRAIFGMVLGTVLIFAAVVGAAALVGLGAAGLVEHVMSG